RYFMLEVFWFGRSRSIDAWKHEAASWYERRSRQANPRLKASSGLAGGSRAGISPRATWAVRFRHGPNISGNGGASTTRGQQKGRPTPLSERETALDDFGRPACGRSILPR